VQVAPGISVENELFDSRNWNVAVVDFNYEFEGEGNANGTNYVSAGKDGGRVIADLFSAEFSRLNNIAIIERSRISNVLDEQALQQSGVIQAEKAASVGKLLGADAVVMGELTDYVSWSNLAGYGSTISFSVRMIDVQTGKVILNGSISRVRQFTETFPNAQLTTRELVDSMQKR
jgi:curli biogenesis system outer membrane secretion channel CsgG